MGDIPQSLLNAPPGGIRPDTHGGRDRARHRSAGSKWSPVGGPAGSQRRNRRSFRDLTPERGATMRKINKKLAVVAAGTAVAVVGGTVAYAYWSSTGTGTDNSTSTAEAGTVDYTT